MDGGSGAGSRTGWGAVVRGEPLLRLITRNPCIFSLGGHRRNTSVMSGSFFLGGSAGVDASVTAVVADMVNRLVHSFVVNVVVEAAVHVIERCVVEEMSVVPAAAFIAAAEISVAVVDAAIEAYCQAPIAFIEKKSTATPAPIARSP